MPKQCALPHDTAAALRDLADKIEAGECTGVAWGAVIGGEFVMRSGSPITESIVLATLLLDWNVRRMRGEG
jgi:hypothetical protein